MGLFNKKSNDEQNIVAPETNLSIEAQATPEQNLAAPDFSAQLGELQPAGPNQIIEIAPAPANLVPESPEMGLIENDPFVEKNEISSGQIEETTGAQVEEPNPILEQQIALDVNIEEVIENGTTKEDEITKIVADNVNTASLVQTIVEQPKPPTSPVEQQDLTPQVTEQAPTPQIEAQPAANIEIATEPSLTPELEPITENATGLPVAEPIPQQEATVVSQPVENVNQELEQPASVPSEQPLTSPSTVEQTLAPQIETQSVSQMGTQADTNVEQTQGQPLILEPGPIMETPTGLPVAEPIQQSSASIPPSVPDQMQANPFNGVEAPIVTENEIVAPTMDLAEQQMAAIQNPETQAVSTEQPTPEAAQPVLSIEPGPILGTPSNDQASLENHDLSQFFVEKNGVMVSQENPNAEIPSSINQPEISKPEIQPSEETAPASLNIDIQNPTTSTQPAQNVQNEIQPEQNLVPSPEIAVEPNPNQEVPAPQIDSNKISEEQSATTETQDPVSEKEEPKVNDALIPKPIVAPLNKEEQDVTNNTAVPQENTDKKVIVQSVPLGRVQPVAPLAVLDNTPETTELSLTQKLSKITQEEQATQVGVQVTSIEEQSSAPQAQQPVHQSSEQPEQQLVQQSSEQAVQQLAEQPEPQLQSEIHQSSEQIEKPIKSDVSTIDIPIPEIEEEHKDSSTTVETKSLDVEQELYTKVEKVPEKMSRNSKRKILRGKEKFSSKEPKEEIITEPMEEKKGLQFCESCGNLISSLDVICPSCGDPVK